MECYKGSFVPVVLWELHYLFTQLSKLLRRKTKVSNNGGLSIGQLPSANGARHLYMNHLRPFLLRHQARLDRVVEIIYGEMSKFISAHQVELQFAKKISTKALKFANGIVRDIVNPGQRQAGDAIEGQTRQIQDSESDKED